MNQATLYLASTSARRRELLERARIRFASREPSVDDGRLSPGTAPAEAWVMAMAYLKGRSVADAIARDGAAPDTWVLAADTVCVVDGRILGKPEDRPAAERMLRGLQGRRHETITGVCLLQIEPAVRLLFYDRALVHVGDVPPRELEAYLDSNEWRGKAGGYNLDDRVAAGWPIVCEGDPSTVMGLPLGRLADLLAPHRSDEP